jgi:hypothetical protein
VQLSIFWLVIIAVVIFRMERGWKSKKLNGKGKSNNQVEPKTKQGKKKSFKDINREIQCTNQL